jgi:hypothetical protein
MRGELVGTLLLCKIVRKMDMTIGDGDGMGRGGNGDTVAERI